MAQKKLLAKNKININSISLGSKIEEKGIGFNDFSDETKNNLRDIIKNSSSIDQENRDISSLIPENFNTRLIERKYLVAAPEEWNFFSKPSDQDLLELAISIYQNGLLQPIVVRKISESEEKYEILAGHSRNSAYELLHELYNEDKYLFINAIVFEYDQINDDRAKEIICDTNFMQRGRLSRRDTANCIKTKISLLKKQNISDIESVISKKYDIKRTSLYMWKKMSNLIPELEKIIDQNSITLKNAYKLAHLSQEDQIRICEELGELITNSAILKIDPKKQSLSEIMSTIEQFSSRQIKIIKFKYLAEESPNKDFVPKLVYIKKSSESDFYDLVKELDYVTVIDAKSNS